jgi:hypothetical protein
MNTVESEVLPKNGDAKKKAPQEIPQRKVAVDLKSQEPSQLTVESIEKQLHNLGLKCEHTKPEILKKYKDEVEGMIPDGKSQTYGIQRPTVSKNGETTYRSLYLNRDAPYAGLEDTANGEWTPSASGLGYMSELSTVIHPGNFQFLKDNKADFAGHKSAERITQQRLATVEAVKSLFVQVGIEASASLVNGIDKTSLNSVLSNAIAPLSEGDVQDYDESDSRVIYLVDNYNPETKEADAIGVLGIDWKLRIVDYKEKKKNPEHDTTLTISTRSVLYDKLSALNEDVLYVKSHMKDSIFSFIPPKGKLKIFDTLPAANEETFLQGLPVIAKDDYTEVIIMYAPNLQSLGSIDSTLSTADISYSKTVTSGFTFEMGQKLTVGAEFEAGVIFAKGKVSVSMELSFTEQWNESTSETTTFSSTAGESCYMYQGYLLSRKLRYYPEGKGKYSYFGPEGRFLTNIVKATQEAIVGQVSDIKEKR